METKVGVAYTYRFLDFLIGKDGKSQNYILNVRFYYNNIYGIVYSLRASIGTLESFGPACLDNPQQPIYP